MKRMNFWERYQRDRQIKKSMIPAGELIPVDQAGRDASWNEWNRKQEAIVGENILFDLGLSPEMLDGLSILDVGAGNRIFEKTLNYHNVVSDVYALDSNERSLMQEDLPSDKIIVRDINEAGVPEIPDASFDLIVDRAGPVLIPETLKELLRILKPNGEIRVAPDPFDVWIPKVMQKIFTENGGQKALTSSEKKQIKKSKLDIDQNGLPLLKSIDSFHFWLGLYENLSYEDK